MKFYKIKLLGMDRYEIEYAEDRADALNQCRAKHKVFRGRPCWVTEAEKAEVKDYCDDRRINLAFLSGGSVKCI